MRVVSFAHNETGIFNGVQLIATSDELVALNTPADHVAIDGHHDHLSKRVLITAHDLEDHGKQWTEYECEVVDWIPPPPSNYHDVWNPSTKRWELNAEETARQQRSNAARVRIAELEAAQHQALRQHALDAPGARETLKGIDDEINSLQEHL